MSIDSFEIVTEAGTKYVCFGGHWKRNNQDLGVDACYVSLSKFDELLSECRKQVTGGSIDDEFRKGILRIGRIEGYHKIGGKIIYMSPNGSCKGKLIASSIGKSLEDATLD